MPKAADFDSDLMEKTKEGEKVQEPHRYTVLLHNDHYTTQQFVTWVLMKVFALSETDAYRKMLEVHRKGKGSVGNYSYDVAQSKAMLTETLARENEFPLRATVEELP